MQTRQLVIALVLGARSVFAGGPMDSTTTGLEPFVGDGEIVAAAFMTGGTSLSGTTSSTIVAEDFVGAGTVRVTYAYVESKETFESSQTAIFAFPLAPGSAMIPIQQFDDAGGRRTLTQVTLSTLSGMGIEISAENDSPLPAPDLGVSLSGLATVDLLTLGTVQGFNETHVTDGTVGPSDGIPGSGRDFWDFGFVTGGELPVVGGCCFGDTCTLVPPDACAVSGGVYLGTYDICRADRCPIPEVVWINPRGGGFDDAGNWTPTLVPGPGQRALFELDAAYTVTFTDDAASDRVVVIDGAPTFALSGHTYTLDAALAFGLVVAGAPEVATELRLEDGSVECLSALLGGDDGATGALVVGLGADVRIDGELFVGALGAGALTVADGGSVLSRSATLGLDAGAPSTATVTGAGSVWSVPLVLSVQHGEIVVVDGGAVAVGLGLFVLEGATVSGDGTIDGNVLNFGAVRPHAEAAGGPLDIVGDYTQVGMLPGLGENSGSLAIALGPGGGCPDHAELRVVGAVELGGGLFVTLEDACVPSIGDTFQIVASASRAGQFDVAAFPPLPSGRLLLQYEPLEAGLATVTIIVAPLVNDGELADPDSETVGDGVPVDAVVADFDGQSGPDIAAVVRADKEDAPGTLLILLNDGSGEGFTVAETLTVGRGPTAVAAGRVDRGDTIDLVVTNALDDTIMLFAGDGAGAFAPRPLVVDLAPGAAPEDVGVADFDEGIASGGQMLDDLIVANPGDRTVLLLVSQGGGVFNFEEVDVGEGELLPLSVDPIDLDNDRTFDAVVTTGGVSKGGGPEDPGFAILLENLGGGQLVSRGHHVVGRGPTDVLVTDLTRDAGMLPEIVVANRLDGTLSVLLNEGDFEFAPAVDVTLSDDLGPRLPISLAGLDLDVDGDDDLAVVVDDPGAGIARLLTLRNDNDVEAGQFALVLPVDQSGNPTARLVVDIDVDLNGVDDLVTFDLGDTGADGARPETVRTIQFGHPFTVADLDGDGLVGFGDLLLVLSGWGPCPPGPCFSDLDGDGEVGLTDLLTILANWS